MPEPISAVELLHPAAALREAAVILIDQDHGQEMLAMARALLAIVEEMQEAEAAGVRAWPAEAEAPKDWPT